MSGRCADAGLINQQKPGSKLSLHQDRNQADFQATIVSVSFGLPAEFLFGGLDRADPQLKVPSSHGDVVVWAARQRLVYHGGSDAKASPLDWSQII